MTRVARLTRPGLLALAALGLAASGCSKDNPVAPEVTPPPVIRTPRSVLIDRIYVTKTPAKTGSGADWDVSLIVAARRPDLYVVLEETASGFESFVSEVKADADPTTEYTFVRDRRAGRNGLPVEIQYGTGHRIYLMDQDIDGNDDRIGWITVNLPSAYNRDNSLTMIGAYRDSGDRIRVDVAGRWVY